MQENILSKKLNLGLNFSTPSGGIASPSLKGSMIVIVTYKLTMMITILMSHILAQTDTNNDDNNTYVSYPSAN